MTHAKVAHVAALLLSLLHPSKAAWIFLFFEAIKTILAADTSAATYVRARKLLDAADFMGSAHQIGAIEPGKFAD
jgi:hypothetical protein